MEKILKKYTTIPQYLYVERYADTQLKRIIEEMQRPGYVLVARQMGKTNLLFNAKRTLENANRLFAYIDLSNLYTNERDCYRNIINGIIEPNLNIFESIENDIEDIRKKDLPPHNEYSRSLVRILNHFQGDLVIILDEIDALKSVNYSDNIFAQIRSNYFSRTNYPVLERLTYVLSGVIEPTELIKDKNKSPFNIGDKIYLDDFTKEEHKSFIEKSKLKVSKILSDEIFDWTNGNPRLTFDICAEIENYIINKGEINSEILNDLINRKYLISFDVAPIDHIRELAKSNKDIRKAILNIYKANTLEISDDVKRKLYLYGIINSKFNEETKIKNKIIEKSLSEDWINSIDKENTFVYGLTIYSEKQYADTINILLGVLDSTKSSIEIEGCHYFIGMSYFKLKKYEKAIEYFAFEYKDVDHKNDSLAYIGVCKMALGNIEGLSNLEDSIKTESNSHAYQTALLNLAININDNDKALILLEKLYDSTIVSDNTDIDEVNQLRTLSLYYQSEILEKQEKRQEALKKNKLAIQNSSLSDSLFLLFNDNRLSDKKDDGLKLEIVNLIVDNNLKFEENNSYPISFQENHIYYYLDFIFNKENLTLFNILLEYAHSKLLSKKSKYEIIYRASLFSLQNKTDILDFLLEHSNEIEDDLLLVVYRDCLITKFKNPIIYLEIFNKFLILFEKESLINSSDIYVFALCIKINSDKNNIFEGIKLCEIISDKVENIGDDSLKFESVIIYYWYSNLYFSLKDRDNAIKYADIALELIKNSNGRNMSMIDEVGLRSISNQLNQIKISLSITKPIVSIKKYSRNDRIKVKYKNGDVKEDKYKKLEADIVAERCVVI